jgi:2,3-bisphosphoglycerate-dependent phosphoglycerate mutase
MTHIYFVRHALPEHNWKEDRTRPLTAEGLKDSRKVAEVLQSIPLDFAIASPYVRSIDTIRECAIAHGLTVATDERLRERKGGPGGSNLKLLKKRWEDFEFHEEGGEAIGSVQQRNIEAVFELLKSHPGESILLGTHATALSSILLYFDPSYNHESFLRILNYMPYIIRLDFEGHACIHKEELLTVDKGFTSYTYKYMK